VNSNSSTPAVSSDVAELKDMVNHPLAYQALAYQAPVSQTQSVSQNDFERYIKANDAVLRNIQSQGQSTQNQCQSTQNQLQTVQNQLANLTDMMSKFMSANTASSLGSGTLPDRTESKPIGIAKDVKVKVGVFHFPADFVVVDFEPEPQVPLILERYSANYDQITANKFDVTDEACEEYSQEVLGFSNVTASGSLTPSDDPIVSTTSPTLTPFEDSDFLLFEEADAFLELKACESKTIKSSIDEPPEVELKDLHPHLEYAFLEGDNKLPVIIVKALRDEEKSALIKVLKSHKRAIAWKLSDIQGIKLEFCTHKILMEEDYKPAVQNQRRVNPKIHDVIKKEVEKLLDAGLIYPISDSPWVSPVHSVPKKGSFTVVTNEENELIPTRLVTGWRIKNRVFNIGDQVLLFNSRLKIFSGKLKYRWSGPFTIAKNFPYGTVELSQANGPNFKVNGHRIKHYFGRDVPQLVVPDL
nr:reverse transcriptase domain-containing protein [Tanacetum cinerariifolium]